MIDESVAFLHSMTAPEHREEFIKNMSKEREEILDKLVEKTIKENKVVFDRLAEI